MKVYIDNILLEVFETTQCYMSQDMQNEGHMSMRIAKVSPQPALFAKAIYSKDKDSSWPSE